MIDFDLAGDFSFKQTESGKFSTVTGRDEFEQSVVVAVNDILYGDAVGEFDSGELKARIKQKISRVARNHSRLEDVADTEISKSPDKANTYIVTINYTADITSDLEVSG